MRTLLFSLPLLLLGLVLASEACAPAALTHCQSADECEQGYACYAHRCYVKCRKGVCDGDTQCVDNACVPTGRLNASSSSGGDSSSQEQSSSAPGDSSGPDSSSGESSSSGGVTSSSSAPPVDVCNGEDDDGDGAWDEDLFALDGDPLELSQDGPRTRVAVAATESGFFVAFAGTCPGAGHSDVLVNHRSPSGQWAADQGICNGQHGKPAYSTKSTQSRSPYLAPVDSSSAVLVWSEAATDSPDGKLYLAEVQRTAAGLDIPPAMEVSVANSAGGGASAWGSVAPRQGGGYLTGVTRGLDSAEEVSLQQLSRNSSGTLSVTGTQTQGASTEGEVALTRLGDVFLVARAAGAYLLVRPVDDNLARVGTGEERRYAGDAPINLRLVTVWSDLAVLGWAEPQSTAAGAPRAVRLGKVRADSSLEYLGNTRLSPAPSMGSFGLSTSGRGELLLVYPSTDRSRIVLEHVKASDGNLCGELTLRDGTDTADVAWMGVASSDTEALVVYQLVTDDQNNRVRVLAQHLVRHRQP